LSIARYRTFAGHEVPFDVTIFVDCIYLSNGLFNVILFSLTRPYLLPHNPRVLNVMVDSGDPWSDTAIGGSSSGGPYEGTSATAHEWWSNPQLGNPTLCCFSESERSVQGSVVPLDKKVGQEE